jgi:DNA-binding CsgD family transcriptional regulator
MSSKNISSNTTGVKSESDNNLMLIYYDCLPPKPYCTNELGSLRILPRDMAITHNYIQHNRIDNLSWLVFDVDRPTAIFDWDDLHAPAPNFLVQNPENGHAHLFYGLETPVHMQYTANIKPIKYASAIEFALCKLLDADKGYSGLISKNPIAKKWSVFYYQPELYDLDWLAGWLVLPKRAVHQESAKSYGLGRNCSLFDATRLWAYSAIREPEYRNNFTLFSQAVSGFALEQNITSFSTPLHNNEVGHIVKSVAKWTYKNMSKDGFAKWGDKRRQASLAKRKSKAKDRTSQILAYAADHPDLSNRQIARALDMDEKTVRNAIKKSQ